ncbi:MAG: 4Fe-4S binding protein [Chloroflexi bacterium]|nr:4Fe-4S binding protein [Chloroflexota bacterium]MBL7061297.1 4Fe-4S binding protein [Dehalococcoidia bacterium]
MADVYERLRERLDMFPQGFPKTESGVELEILQHLFTPEEAEVMLHLRPRPEKVSTIADRAGKDETELGETLYGMSKRGLILRHRAPDEEMYYFLIPWVIGIYEFQLNNLTPENIELYERFYQEGMVPSWRNKKTGMFRVIPVEKEIQGGTEIQPYEKVSQIIDSNTRFAVADCICRKEKRMVGEGCDKLLEACMSFGRAADFYIENGLGREISQEEARRILLKAEEDGLIHCSSNHAGNKDFICNCCGCCCGVLANITKYDNPAAITKSNYYATKDEDTCTTCGTCVERCQVGAIQFENDLTVINRERCIGCGLCVSTCPTGSISMVKKSPEEASAVFSSGKEMLQAMGKETGKKFPFE